MLYYFYKLRSAISRESIELSTVQILVLVARSLTENTLMDITHYMGFILYNPRMTEAEKGSMLQLSATWVSQS